jgi:hypothetical protein
MSHTCPRCARRNPPAAQFCYHDGHVLSGGARQAVDPAKQRFPMPFVFPSGQVCHSFDELVLAVQDNWESARELLRHGVFSSFLGGLGRSDLVVAAREASEFPDRDRGLAQLLERLPASVLEAARLVVEPAQVNLGRIRPGQDLRFDLRLHNSGMGLVAGSISCEACPWLVLGDPNSGIKSKLFQFLHDSTIPVVIRGKALSASNKLVSGKLVLESAGKLIEVPVKIEVPVLPFPEGVLMGATTPRQVAEKAKAQPKEAADLFARGAVARWYQTNGWTYPVQEPSASGLAAVQQFFEALGLTAPPKVGINVAEVRLSGRAGEAVRSMVVLTTQEKKPVFAHATSDQDWLQVNEVQFEGRSATVHLRISNVPDRGGETLRANLSVVSNGRQKFVLPVYLQVAGRPPVRVRIAPEVAEVVPIAPYYAFDPPAQRREEIPEVVPVADLCFDEPTPRRIVAGGRVPEAVPKRAPRRSRWAALAPVLFLALGLSVTLVCDLVALMRKPAEGGSAAVEDWDKLPQLLRIAFHDTEEPVNLARGGSVKPTPDGPKVETFPAKWEASMRFGLELADPDALGKRKRLTFQKNGTTNNTVVLLDGKELIFGERPFRDVKTGRYLGEEWPGRWLDRTAKLDRRLRDGRRSIWVYDAEQVHVTQTVGLVPGAQSGKIDTCLVHYRIDNKGSVPHRVGLRFLLDTFIGGNDGVPFLIPGRERLCDDKAEFRTPAEVPDFIQARESDDMRNPGTIALIQLRIPGMEPPSRVTLGAWPNPSLGEGCGQEKTLWEVPVFPIKANKPPDSAVTIYWNPVPIDAGKSREVAFAYGLGSVSAGEGGGQLGLSVAGSFAPRGEFTLTAEVRNPVAGQTLTLTLPEGFDLVTGGLTQPVPVGGSASAVTWKVRGGPRQGTYTLGVKSSTGVAQTQKVDIKVRGIFGN